MSKPSRAALALIVLSVLATVSTVAHASTNYVVDGSFEDTTVAPGTWTNVASTSGWLAGPAGLELRDADFGTAEDGANFAELDTTRNSAITQTLATTAGTYTLSFWVEDRPGTTVATNGIAVMVNGALTSIQGKALSGWTEFTQTFTTSGATLLSFAALGTSDSFGSSLDNISVTAAVPEPGEVALMASGLALLGLGWRGRRSRR